MTAHFFATTAGRPGSELAGAAVAVLSAVLYVAGYVLEKQGLSGLPEMRLHPVAILRTATRSRRWIAGFAAMLCGLGLQVVALTLAPVSVVQPILACGLLALAAAGPWLLDEELGRRDTFALGMVLLAAVAIASSARGATSLARSAPPGRFALLGVPILALAVLSARLGAGRPGRRPALVPLAVGAGLLYGFGAVAEKAVATRLVSGGLVGGAWSALGTAYPWLFVGATVAGLTLFQVGLQSHPASLMASLTNVVSTGCALAGATVVFSEKLLPPGWWVVARLAGFAGILVAVVVLAQGPSATRIRFEEGLALPPEDASSPRSVRAPS